MPVNTSKFDPWGPISSTLYALNNSDLVEEIIGYTGLAIKWPVLGTTASYSHSTRIRAYKPIINAAYSALDDPDRALIATTHDDHWGKSGIIEVMAEDFIPNVGRDAR